MFDDEDRDLGLMIVAALAAVIAVIAAFFIILAPQLGIFKDPNSGGAQRIAAEAPSGDDLVTRVRSALASETDELAESVEVAENAEGVITLTGTVPTETDREEAEEIARLVDGVTDVDNQLTIGESTESEATGDGGTGDLAAAVRTGLVEGAVPGAEDTIDVQAGEPAGLIVLTGTVSTEDDRTATEEVARATQGVTEVDNQLVVEAATDTTVASAATPDTAGGDTLAPPADTTVPPDTSAPAQASTVTATADEAGSVTLTGRVASDAVRTGITDALEAALPGRVVDQLQIDPSVAAEPVQLVLAGSARESVSAPLREAIASLGAQVTDQLQVTAAPKLETDLNALFTAEPIQFDTGSATIRPASLATIDKAAALLTAAAQGNVTIEGHTDSQGNPAQNKTLSQRRADAVKAELVERGVGAARLSAVGFGADRPVADNGTPAGRQANRRVVALVTA